MLYGEATNNNCEKSRWFHSIGTWTNDLAIRYNKYTLVCVWTGSNLRILKLDGNQNNNIEIRYVMLLIMDE